MLDSKKILVTGGLGFIGSCFVTMALERGYKVINVDKKTYAVRKDVKFKENDQYQLIVKDICDLKALPPDIGFIINFAAESHVENSIKDTSPFFKSNIQGVYNLLELVRKTPEEKRPVFIQISTDEVYGDILEGSFKEDAKLTPSSPYSASKAAADQLVMGWGRTYSLRWRICRSGNNYGFGQHPEKLIPRVMKRSIKGLKSHVHGSGMYRREWIHTEDNCAAIFLIMEKGADNEVYNISTNEEWTNLDVIKKILRTMGKPEDFIEFVENRQGQDLRYSIHTEKIRQLGWQPQMTLDVYLPICRQLTENRTKNLPPGKKKRLLRLLGLEKIFNV